MTARPAVAFLEAHTENVIHAGGRSVRELESLRADYPLSLHGVGLAPGSAAGLDREHLRRVKQAVRRFEPALVSEHACWGHVDGRHFNDLLPLPWSEEALEVMVAAIGEIQDTLGQSILVENLSHYLRLADSTLTEGEFLAALAGRSGCGLLLDLNNLHVSQMNVGQCARATITSLPLQAVGEFHLAGHRQRSIDGQTLLIDDHGSRVCPEVWDLYQEALARFGALPTLIEWDTDLPPLGVLLEEVAVAEHYQRLLHGPVT